MIISCQNLEYIHKSQSFQQSSSIFLVDFSLPVNQVRSDVDHVQDLVDARVPLD